MHVLFTLFVFVCVIVVSNTYCVVFWFCLYLSFALCTQFCQCLWIVHSYLPFRYSLTFICSNKCQQLMLMSVSETYNIVLVFLDNIAIINRFIYTVNILECIVVTKLTVLFFLIPMLKYISVFKCAPPWGVRCISAITM